MCGVALRASPPHTHKHTFSLNIAAGECKILLLSGMINGPFCSGHFNPFKSFVFYYGFGQ
jgi:hypothetical protein